MVLLYQAMAQINKSSPPSTATAKTIKYVDIKYVEKYRQLLQQKKEEIYRAEELDRQSREAMMAGDPEKALSLLQEAITILQGTPQNNEVETKESPKKIHRVMENNGMPSYKDSPFGIFDPYEIFLDRPTFITRSDINEYLKDLGVKWVQAMPREDIGELDMLAKTGINIYSRAIPFPHTRRRPEMPDAYKEYLRNLVKKYKDKIKYWEADTEPEGFTPYSPDEGWQGHPEKYTEFLRVTSGIIKEECKDCKIVLGGLGGPEIGLSGNSNQVKFLESVLEAGGGKYFDVLEFKQTYHKASEYTELKNKMEIYGRVLAKYGIDIYKIPVFIETAMYDGSPVTLNHPPLPYQSERQEAGSLLKTYVFGIAHGIDKIFWINLVKRGPDQMHRKEIFYCYGLINNPQNEGKSHKKLSYYTYKKMVEILEGSNWNHIEIIQEEDGVYIYKFTKNANPIWVAWNDNKESKKVRITLRKDTKNVKSTEGVPIYESGQDVKDYKTAFKEIKENLLKNHPLQLEFELRESPVFVEEN
jgi:hypothetical protein